MGNGLIQFVLHKETSLHLLHPPVKFLLRTLSVSDLCVGLVSESGSCCYLLVICSERPTVHLSLCSSLDIHS